MIVMTTITIMMRRNRVCWDRGNLTLAGKINNKKQKTSIIPWLSPPFLTV